MFCEAKLNIGRFKETIGFFKAKEGGGKRCVVCVSVYVCVLSSKVRRRVPWPWRSTHHE